MRVLKILVLLIVLIIIAAVTAYYVLPSSVHVEQTIEMSASPKAIFEEVNNLKNWENWGPWINMDTAMIQSYEGTADGGIGMIRKFKSNNKDVGIGEMEIIESRPYEFIKNELRFGPNKNNTGYGSWTFEPIGENTKVTWAFDAEMNGIVRFFAPAMDQMMSPIFQQGLDNLKILAESKPKIEISNESLSRRPLTGCRCEHRP